MDSNQKKPSRNLRRTTVEFTYQQGLDLDKVVRHGIAASIAELVRRYVDRGLREDLQYIDKRIDNG